MKKILLSLLSLLSVGILSAQPDFTSPNGTSNNVYPFNSTVNRVQWIYHPGDFTPAITPGFITKLYVMVHPPGLGVSGTANFTNLTINMGHTTNANTVNGPWLTGMTNVFTAPTFSVLANLGQWAEFTLQTPFFYDGVSNLLMEISQTGYSPGFYIVNETSTGSRRAWGTVGSTMTTGAGTGLMYMGIDMLNENEMGVIGITKPADLNDICAGLTKFTVEVKNFGSNDILTGNVSYSINNVYKGTAAINGTITPQNTREVELPGFVQTLYNVPFLFKAWSHDPNNLQDPLPLNDTFEITITPSKLGVVLNDLTDTAICKGSSITLDAGTNANTDYTWSNGTQAQHNTIALAGTYWVWGYNTEGCQSFDTFEVTYAPSPSAALNISVIDLANGTLLFSIGNVQNVTEYIWDFGDNTPLEYGMGPKPHNYATAGTYEVKLTMKNACDSIQRFFKLIYSGTTSVHELNKDASFEIYPNPVKDYLEVNIVNPAASISSYSIVNVLGQTVVTEQIKQNNFRINTTQLSSGNYLIKVQTNAGEVVKPFTVRK